ncbi:MAG: methyltransferase domain-containing protein [Pseudomonadota bacterium]|nr:methyltransferase domain-containing protein [Pseudomonadota bacterium]
MDRVVIDQASDRLAEINREFDSPAIIGDKADFWAKRLKMVTASLIEDSDTIKAQRGKFDLVILALSLHWYNDPIGQLIQARKLLRPDGLMLGFTFAGKTLYELRSAFEKAEVKVENGMSPRVAPMADIRDLGDLLVRANFSLPVADKIKLVFNYSSPLELLRDLRRMGETNNMVQRRKNFLRRETLKYFVDYYKEDFPSAEDAGSVKATFEIVCLTGWAPCISQQKPISPGSAKKHFSEVLRTFEL